MRMVNRRISENTYYVPFLHRSSQVPGKWPQVDRTLNTYIHMDVVRLRNNALNIQKSKHLFLYPHNKGRGDSAVLLDNKAGALIRRSCQYT